jgi:hypothetical protein
MERRALIAARDISGLGEFSSRISQAHGYRIITVRGGEGEGVTPDETVEWQEAQRLIREGEISLLVANFFDPATVGRLSITISWTLFDWQLGVRVRWG